MSTTTKAQLPSTRSKLPSSPPPPQKSGLAPALRPGPSSPNLMALHAAYGNGAVACAFSPRRASPPPVRPESRALSPQPSAGSSSPAAEAGPLQLTPATDRQPEAAHAPAPPRTRSTPPNTTGLPDGLKSGIEALSGISMDGVNVDYNSPQPAQLNALAYAQGRDIHVAPGQERHLPHEAWHVVQQAQGRVKPTMQLKDGVPVNDDEGLEHEADVMGAKAFQMTRGTPLVTSLKSPASTSLKLEKGTGSSAAIAQGVFGALPDAATVAGPETGSGTTQVADETDEEESEQEGDKKQVAQDFYEGLVDIGRQVYLSGGGAIGYQGGTRPISDLDFRIAAKEAGFNNFHDPEGVKLLTHINKKLVPRGSQPLAPIGKDALTIGTNNWKGVELSLSVSGSRQNTVMLPGGETTPKIAVLSLHELMADKLKTMVSRTKKGEESVKKVAQDVYDFLDVVRLIDASEGPRLMSEHVDEAVFARLGNYAISNLEGVRMEHVSNSELQDLIKARAVLTAHAHVKGGVRKEAFQKLCTQYENSLDSLLGKLSRLGVRAVNKSELRPWMTEWNDSSHQGPPRRGEFPSRLARLRSPQGTRTACTPSRKWKSYSWIRTVNGS